MFSFVPRCYTRRGQLQHHWVMALGVILGALRLIRCLATLIGGSLAHFVVVVDPGSDRVPGLFTGVEVVVTQQFPFHR